MDFDLKNFTYREGDISALFCVENYLIKNGFTKVVTKLQKKLKPLIVYDYLTKNGYEEVSKKFAKAILKKKNHADESAKAFIRRSERLKKNQTADITQRLSEAGPDDSKLPLKVCYIVGKNRGVVPTKKLFKGEFVVEYAGELIDKRTAKEREKRYAMDISKNCYMYYFKTNGKHYW